MKQNAIQNDNEISLTDENLGINVVKPTTEQGSKAILIDKKQAHKRLTIRQKKFVTAKIKGMNNDTAYTQAGYKASTNNVARVEGSKLMKKPNIQQAIDDALASQELTPEYAIGQLKTIVDQNDEIGAKRLAIKDVLELHGWRKNERPAVSLTVNNAFFGNSRVVKNNNSSD